MSNEGKEKKEPAKRMSGAQMSRTIFGIFMIVIYVGMGILFLIDFFNWETAPWGWLRWVAGFGLIIYGIWRAYRQFAGIDRNIGDED